MSLNKTLDRLFDEIRREAKRNPAFADRLDAVLRLHDSRRDVDEGVIEEVSSWTAGVSPADKPAQRRAAGETPADKLAQRRAAGETPGVQDTPGLNPVAVFRRDGEDALAAALAALDEAGLRALIAEHNLDPAGETEAMDEAGLARHIVAHARRRAERDERMFDY